MFACPKRSSRNRDTEVRDNTFDDLVHFELVEE